MRQFNHSTLLFALLTTLFAAAMVHAADKQSKEATMNKSLVVYFSATGTTKGVAERLAAAIGADIQELKPATPYTAADLNWRDKKSRSTVEMADRASRPAIQAPLPDVSAYSTVFVGFPIWWYREPSIIDTFIESSAKALEGKVVAPFATSGGSGMGESSAIMQKLAPAAKVVEGHRFRANATAEELATWAKSVK